MRIPALIAAALLPMSVGCLQQVDYIDDVNTDFFGSSEGYRDLQPNIRDGILSGKYGEGVEFNEAEVTDASGYTDGYSSNVTLITNRNNRMGMLIIDTYDSSLLTLPAGTYTSDSSMDSKVTVFVCSTDFDAPADDATVTIEDAPDGTRNITVDAVVSGDYYGMDNRNNPAIADFNLSR